jgi:hypothetical protein
VFPPINLNFENQIDWVGNDSEEELKKQKRTCITAQRAEKQVRLILIHINYGITVQGNSRSRPM